MLRLHGRRHAALALSFAAAFAVLGASEEAQAFCRTTTVAVPANYNPQSRGCFTDGLYLFWKNACLSYSINESASTNIPLGDATRIIDGAFGIWPSSACANGKGPGLAISNIGNAVCSEVRYNDTGPNQNLVVFRDDGWPYNDPNSTLGLTTVTFNALTGEIFDADMELNSSGRNLSTTDKVPANGFDLLSVVTHEAGHFYGLAHATDATATMYASYKPGTAALRTLTADDVAGLCAIYPDASTRIVSDSVSASGTLPADACDPTPRHGFTAECVGPPVETEDSGGCALTPRASMRGPRAAFASAGLALVALVVVRRRRAKRIA